MPPKHVVGEGHFAADSFGLSTIESDGGVSIKLNGDTNCSNGQVASQKTSSSISNKTIIHQDSRGNGSYNCAGNVVI